MLPDAWPTRQKEFLVHDLNRWWHARTGFSHFKGGTECVLVMSVSVNVFVVVAVVVAARLLLVLLLVLLCLFWLAMLDDQF